MKNWLFKKFIGVPAWALCLVAAIYTIYFFGSAPKLEADAKNFYMGSEAFMSGFWAALIHSFPAREPAYPLTIYALSLIVPQPLLPKATTFLQLGMLLVTAVLFSTLASSLSLKHVKGISLAVFLNVALSPSLLTSSLSLYTEILAMFFFSVWIYFLWRALMREDHIIRDLVLSGISGSLLMISRGAYLYILLLAISILPVLSYLYHPFFHLKNRMRILFLHAVILISLPALWMTRNSFAYGVFTMADHSGIVFAGRYEKAKENYTVKDFLAGSLNSISESACKSVFKNCYRYGWEYANVKGFYRVQQMASEHQVNYIKANQLAFKDTVKNIISQHPIRFALFGWFEFIQLVFFETMGTGANSFTNAYLNSIHQSQLARGLAHIGLSIFYLIGLGILIFNAAMLARRHFNQSFVNGILVLMIPYLSFLVIYSSATTVIRYSFVVAPLCIMMSWLGWSLVIPRFRKALFTPDAAQQS
ncbi:MAG: hypothetical protein LHV69_00595 [Elusimicrobia bacterium]|nr:hypothetical protein [Candidatus Obscuribacterium magneticum]